MVRELGYKKIRIPVYVLLLCTTLPFLLLLNKVNFGNTPHLLLTVGSVSGFIGAVLLLWQVAFGLRFISTKFSKDLVWFNGLHQKMGRYGTLLIFVHPFLKAATYSGGLSLVLFPNFDDPFWLEISYGRIAFFLLLVVWITSVFFRKKLGFRMWKYIHYLAYLILFLHFYTHQK
jgi:DMSO/TMAO reductase YedYZ heme-binding membrane subunit